MRASGLRSVSAIPTARPTIPPPTMAKSYVMVTCALSDLPGRLPFDPQIFQQALVAQRVHALPETFVLICGKLAVLRQRLQRLVLEPAFVVGDEIEDLRLQHEKSAVDPARLALGLLDEFSD